MNERISNDMQNIVDRLHDYVSGERTMNNPRGAVENLTYLQQLLTNELKDALLAEHLEHYY